MPPVIQGRFDDFDEFTEGTADWDIDFRQLGKGLLSAGSPANQGSGTWDNLPGITVPDSANCRRRRWPEAKHNL
jgi:hypothetical protein